MMVRRMRFLGFLLERSSLATIAKDPTVLGDWILEAFYGDMQALFVQLRWEHAYVTYDVKSWVEKGGRIAADVGGPEE